jgi:hypothetical protein
MDLLDQSRGMQGLVYKEGSRMMQQWHRNSCHAGASSCNTVCGFSKVMHVAAAAAVVLCMCAGFPVHAQLQG